MVDAKKTPYDLSIPPATYPGNFRKGVMIADPKSTQGLYPKVFIASGKNVSAKAPEGKVVHVPYTDLLNADGTPKAAKEIWKVLMKAGSQDMRTWSASPTIRVRQQPITSFSG